MDFFKKGVDYSLVGLGSRLFGGKPLGKPFNFEAADKAADAAKQPWEKKMEEFNTMLAELANKAKNLNKPLPLNVEESVINNSKKRLLQGHLTDLQRVGAYASPASVALIDVQKRSEKHLKSIDSKIGAANAGRGHMGKVHYG
jgi:hypothetical protein